MVQLLRRFGYALLTALVAVSLAFVALRVLPGDAIAAQLIGTGATPSQIAARRALLGLDQPLLTQYLSMLWGMARGDFGYSLLSGRAVGEILGEQFGATIALTSGAIGIGIVAGLWLGLLAVVGRWKLLRIGASLCTTILIASPVYWSGTLLIYLFSVQWRWLPSTGRGEELRFLILPWLVLGLNLAGSIARLTSANLLDYRHADFVRTARVKGLREGYIIRQHVLRAGLASIISLIALQTAFLLGGAVVTEMIFVRRGIGQILLTAMNDRDYPVVQGIVMLSAIIYSLISAAADLIAGMVDPRFTEAGH